MENNRCFGCMEEKQNHPICEHCGFDERQQNLPHQLPMGSILRGQYLIGRVLGQGGFGITYLGWDLYLQMPVAVKEFYPSSCVTRNAWETSQITCYTGPESKIYEANKARFMREGQALARFKNLQNIVQIYSFFPENNTVYLVMEYAKGHTLQQHLKRNGPMPLSQVLRILTPIMEDLQQVHEAGIVHRDISPDNIMLLDKGGAKLLDFGAVRQVEDPDQENQLSKSTEAILKQGFAPVEQYNSRGFLGPWTDVYAMCATICYCLNGKLPKIAPDRTIDDDPDHFIDILPIGEAQKAVLKRGMAIRPKDRIASMGELLGQLKQSMNPALRQKTASDQPRHSRQAAPRPAPVKPKPRKKPWWLLGVAAAAILALVLLLPKALKQPDPRSAKPPAAAPEATGAPVPVEDLVLKNFDPKGESDFAFGTSIKKQEVAAIQFLDSMEAAPDTAVDVSETGKGKVLLWAEPSHEGKQNLYIAGDGKVYFPRDCGNLFGTDSMDSGKTFNFLRTIDFSGAVDTSRMTDMSGMFSYCSSLKSLDLSSFDTSQVTDMAEMFKICSTLESLDLSSFDTSQVTDMSGMFGGCMSLKNLDFSRFNTSQVTDMGDMFWLCSRLKSLNLSSFDTSQVTNMNSMFEYCSRITSVNLSSFDTSQVTDMSGMFWYCGSLGNVDLSSFDTSRVTSMSAMFIICCILVILDLSSFDTSRVTSMECMFNSCSRLKSLDLSSFDTSQVTNTERMFNECSRLKSLDLSSFDTAQAANHMYGMFFKCDALTAGNLRTNDSRIRDQLLKDKPQ